jgi:hypothetical protein
MGQLLDKLQGGDQRSIGHVPEVVAGEKFPPMWLRFKARYSEVRANVRFNRAA